MSKWERGGYAVLGAAAVVFSLWLISKENNAGAALAGGMGILILIFGNLSRFKSFKGYGLEAELWEEKKKEADDLIERLKSIVETYTREILVSKVKAGRLGSSSEWGEHWTLYDKLVSQHRVLGVDIDLTDVKKTMDDYFLFDMTSSVVRRALRPIGEAKVYGEQAIRKEYGPPEEIPEHIKAESEAKHRKLQEIPQAITEPLIATMNGNFPRAALNLLASSRTTLQQEFGIDVVVDPNLIARLERLAGIYDARPVVVTDELIRWANREE